MNSKTSSNNVSFFRLLVENLRHRTWMIALSILGSFVSCPLAYQFLMSARLKNTAYMDVVPGAETPEYALMQFQYLKNYLTDVHLVLQMCVLFVGALIVAIAGFSHLYSGRTVDLYHSAPVKREKFFGVVYLNGFLIWFVPFLAGNLCVLIMMFSVGTKVLFSLGIFSILIKEILLCTLCFLVVYTGALVPLMFSGSAMNAFMNICITGSILWFFLLLSDVYFSHYMSTYHGDMTMLYHPLIQALSTLISPVFLCIYSSNFWQCDGMSDLPLITRKEFAVFLALVLLKLVLDFAAAYRLYRKRPSELSGSGVRNPLFQAFIRIPTAVFAGLILSIFFEGVSGAGQVFWLTFGAVFGCVLVFCFINIIFHLSFKALFRYKLQMLVTVGLCMAVALCFKFDLFGYDSYLPKKESVVGLSFSGNMLRGAGFNYVWRGDGYGSTYNYRNANGDYDILFTDNEKNYTLLKMLVENHLANESDSRDYTTYYNDSRTRYRSPIYVKVITTRGSYERSYEFYPTEENRELLLSFLGSEEYINRYFPAAGASLKQPEEIILNSLSGKSYVLSEEDEIERFYQIYAADFKQNLDFAYLFSGGNHGGVQMEYHFARSKDPSLLYPTSDGNYQYCSLGVPENYERFLKLCEETFPEDVWRKEKADYLSLDIKIAWAMAGSTRESLSAYLNQDTYYDVSVPAEEAEKYRMHLWYLHTESPAEIRELLPYLHLGDSYPRPDYTHAGTVTLAKPGSGTVKVYCYLKAGEVPDELLDKLQFLSTDEIVDDF